MSEYGETVGKQTKPLMPFDEDAKRTENLIENRDLNHELYENRPLSGKQKLALLIGAAAATVGSVFAYKHGIFNSAESEQKGLLSQENHQKIDNPSEQNK